MFFPKTRIGRALRAVADSHKAALSVGISLNQIWVIVWFAAGIVALVTGIMWGARSDVSFALQIIALKALPVLILGGFTSIPGAIVGGLIIGIGEKLGEFYWGPLRRRRHRDLARLRHRARSSCCSGRRACSARRSSSGFEESIVFYREAGQYKTSYAADMAVFPLRRTGSGSPSSSSVAYRGSPSSATTSCSRRCMIPFLIFSLAAIGLNILTGYAGLLSLGTGAFMGVGAYACYKLTTVFPGVNIIVWILVSGFFSAAIGVLFGLPSLRIKGFYLAVATLAAQFFLQWCFIRVPWLYNYNVSGAIEAPLRTLFGVPIVGADRDAADALSRRADPRRRPDLGRLEPRPRPHRPHVDGGARHGHRGRADGHPAAADEAPRLRRLVLLLRRRRRADGLPLVRRRRVRRLRHQPVLPHPVHGDHRRARQPDRLLLRRGLHLHPADRARHRAAGDPQPLRHLDRLATRSSICAS